MTELRVVLGLRHGWLMLSLRTGESEISVSGTTLSPILADLVAGLQDIADGRRAVSVRWDGEPDGVFLDFSQGEAGWNSGLCSVAIHPVDQQASELLGDTSAVRGPAIFTAMTATAGLLTAFVEAITAVRPDVVAVTRRPRRPFPDEAFAHLVSAVAG